MAPPSPTPPAGGASPPVGAPTPSPVPAAVPIPAPPPPGLIPGVPIADNPTLRATLDGCRSHFSTLGDHFKCIEPYTSQDEYVAVFRTRASLPGREGSYWIDTERDGIASRNSYSRPLRGPLYGSTKRGVRAVQGPDGRIYGMPVEVENQNDLYFLDAVGSIYRADPNRGQPFAYATQKIGYVNEWTARLDNLMAKKQLVEMFAHQLQGLPVATQEAVLGDLQQFFRGGNYLSPLAVNPVRARWTLSLAREAAETKPDEKKALARERIAAALRPIDEDLKLRDYPFLLRTFQLIAERHGVVLDLASLSDWDALVIPGKGEFANAPVATTQRPRSGPDDAELVGFARRDDLNRHLAATALGHLSEGFQPQEAWLKKTGNKEAADELMGRNGLTGLEAGGIGWFRYVHFAEEASWFTAFNNYAHAELWAKNQPGSHAIVAFMVPAVGKNGEPTQKVGGYRVYALDREIEPDADFEPSELPGGYHLVSIVTSEGERFGYVSSAESSHQALHQQEGTDAGHFLKCHCSKARALQEDPRALQDELFGIVPAGERKVLYIGEGREGVGQMASEMADMKAWQDGAEEEATRREVFRRHILEMAIETVRKTDQIGYLTALDNRTLTQATQPERAWMIERVLRHEVGQRERDFIAAVFQTSPASPDQFDPVRWLKVYPVMQMMMAGSPKKQDQFYAAAQEFRTDGGLDEGSQEMLDSLLGFANSVSKLNLKGALGGLLGGAGEPTSGKKEADFPPTEIKLSWQAFSRGAAIDGLRRALQRQGVWDRLIDQFPHEERGWFLTSLRDMGASPIADFTDGLAGSGYVDGIGNALASLGRGAEGFADRAMYMVLWPLRIARDVVLGAAETIFVSPWVSLYHSAIKGEVTPPSPISGYWRYGEPGQILGIVGMLAGGAKTIVEAAVMGDGKTQTQLATVALGLSAITDRKVSGMIETGQSSELVFNYGFGIATESVTLFNLRYFQELMGWPGRLARAGVGFTGRAWAQLAGEAEEGAVLTGRLRVATNPIFATRLAGGIRGLGRQWTRSFRDAAEVDQFVRDVRSIDLISGRLREAGANGVARGNGAAERPPTDLELLPMIPAWNPNPTEGADTVRAVNDLERSLARLEGLSAAMKGEQDVGRLSILRRQADRLADIIVARYNEATQHLFYGRPTIWAAERLAAVRSRWPRAFTTPTFANGVRRTRNWIGGEERVWSVANGAGPTNGHTPPPALSLTAERRGLLDREARANLGMVREYRRLGAPRRSARVFSMDFVRGPHRTLTAEVRGKIDRAVGYLEGVTGDYRKMLAWYDGGSFASPRRIRGRYLGTRTLQLDNQAAADLGAVRRRMVEAQDTVQRLLDGAYGVSGSGYHRPWNSWSQGVWGRVGERPFGSLSVAERFQRAKQLLDLTEVADADVTPARAKKAYRRLTRVAHPDHNPGPHQGEFNSWFKQLSEAYQFFTDYHAGLPTGELPTGVRALLAP